MATPLKSKYVTVPGAVLIHRKWNNTSLFQELKVKFNSVNVRDLGPYDFCLYGEKFVIYVPESDLVLCVNLDKFSNINRNDTIIIAVRNTITAEQYLNLQEKLVIKCNQTMIPIGNASEIPDLLLQLSDTDSTPKKSFIQESSSVPLSILLNVPGLGKSKAEKLINTFGTVSRIASSSVSELSHTLGLNLAAEVYTYFH